MVVVPQATLESLAQILAGKYFFTAAMTMLFYDHLLTFPQEVQVIWKRQKTYLSYLFIIVRYYALCSVSIVAYAYFSTAMTRERCGKWMLFLPFGVTMPLALLPGILMSIRVYALYNRNGWILGGLLFYLCCQTAAGLWQYSVPGGTPAPDPLPNDLNFHFCIYLPPKKIGHLSTMYVFMELAFDSIVFLLTVARTTYIHWHQQRRFITTPSARWGAKQPSSLLLSLFRDGAFYFGIIFSINLCWVLMILHAPTGLRAIASVPSGCFITTMISRITLNLRSTAYGPTNLDERTGGVAGTFGFSASIPLSEVRRTQQRESATLTTAQVITTVYNEDGDILEDIETPQSELPFSNGNGFGGVDLYDHKAV